jgi:hypothetical protein
LQLSEFGIFLQNFTSFLGSSGVSLALFEFFYSNEAFLETPLVDTDDPASSFNLSVLVWLLVAFLSIVLQPVLT